MNSGRISVVIPVFNGAGFIGEAIESVLAQDEKPLEIIVVDDGSTDNSAEIAESFGSPVLVLRQENRGPAAARNRGLRAARGQYIAFLDADDLYSPDKFALQADRLDRHPGVDIVIGKQRYLRPPGIQAEAERILADHEDRFTLPFNTCLFRRSVFDRVGLADETMRMVDDWDWFMRAREARVPLMLHRHVVLYRRLHEANITRDRETGAREALKMMRRSLARRKHSDSAPALLPPLSTFLESEEESNR